MRIRKINPNLNSPSLTFSGEDKAKLASLRELFTRLPDPRIPGRVCFPLPEILMIAFCAMLADCNHFTEMELFARSQAHWLGLFLDLPNGTPSHDVFRSAFIAIKPAVLLELMSEWAGILTHHHIIIDGKCLRGTNQGRQGAAAKVYLLRAWVKEAGLTIAQIPCGEKSGELTNLGPLLGSLNLEGNLITIDAMGTHPEVAEQIHVGGADYVLCLKKNQPQAFAEVQAHFIQLNQIDPALPTAPLPPTPAGYDRNETVELSHGRYEQRITTTTGDLDWFTRSWKWHGLQSITEIRRLTHRNGPREALSEEVHYYLSSLPPEAERLAKVVRGHWAVENTCHHVLDMTFGEDHCQVQDAHAAQNLSLLREMAAKVIRDEPTKGSIASKRKRACLDPVFRLKMLLAGITSLFKA